MRTKVTFIWSNYQRLEESRNMYLKKAEKSEDMYHKTKIILDNLDKPFNLMSVQLDKIGSGKGSTYEWKTHPKEFEYADKIENQLKTSLNLKSIKWLFIVKILLLSLIVLSFLNMFIKADFINMLIPVYILAMLSQSMSGKMFDNMKSFLIFTTFTLITDLLWLIFRDSTNISDAGGENGVRKFVYFTSIISFIVKVVLVFSLWIVKLKLERGHKEGLEN